MRNLNQTKYQRTENIDISSIQTRGKESYVWKHL